MKNSDDLQFSSITHGEFDSDRNKNYRGRVVYTDDKFTDTNTRSNGTKKGKVRWNSRKFVTTMILTGASFVVVTSGIHAFKNMSAPPKEPIAIETQVEQDNIIVTPIEEVEEEKVYVNYRVKFGDSIDGISWDVGKTTEGKERVKDFIIFYNGIDGVFREGQVITIQVPKSMAAKYSTPGIVVDNSDEVSVLLNDSVQETLNDVGEYAVGSLMDTVVKELEVYNNSASPKTRKHLASLIFTRVQNIRDYGNDITNSEEKGKSR